jgi:hypothetical protein
VAYFSGLSLTAPAMLFLVGDFSRSHGTGTVEIVYGAAILLLCGTMLIRKYKKNTG